MVAPVHAVISRVLAQGLRDELEHHLRARPTGFRKTGELEVHVEVVDHPHAQEVAEILEGGDLAGWAARLVTSLGFPPVGPIRTLVIRRPSRLRRGYERVEVVLAVVRAEQEQRNEGSANDV